MKLRCLLVDDEPEALAILESYVQLVENLELVGSCENAIQAFQVLQEKPVDLVLLDIAMPILPGTDFVRSLRKPPLVIFTTAYRDYALDGFGLEVVDYLLKPIPFGRFLQAIARAAKNGAMPMPAPESHPVTPMQETFLYVRDGGNLVKVLTRDILYIESLKDYSRINTTTAAPLLVKQSIRSLEAMLPDAQFIRVHRSFLVAIDKVQRCSATQIEVDEQTIPVGAIVSERCEAGLAGRLNVPGTDRSTICLSLPIFGVQSLNQPIRAVGWSCVKRA